MGLFKWIGNLLSNFAASVHPGNYPFLASDIPRYLFTYKDLSTEIRKHIAYKFKGKPYYFSDLSIVEKADLELEWNKMTAEKHRLTKGEKRIFFPFFRKRAIQDAISEKIFNDVIETILISSGVDTKRIIIQLEKEYTEAFDEEVPRKYGEWYHK